MDGKSQRPGASSGKSMTVTMEVDTLDCPICFHPLSSPIFQCSVGHFLCSSCRSKLLDQKCHLCSTKTSFKRCFGMEQVVQSVNVSCHNAMYGCTRKMPYYLKEGHEKECPASGCFCPVGSCTFYFYGSTETLLEHITTEHQIPSTTLLDSDTVSLHLQPGLHALRRNKTSYLFLLSLSLLPVGHAISIFCVQPKPIKPKFTCDMRYDCFTTGFSESSSCHIRSASFSEGIPAGYDLILPKGKFPDDQKSILLRITIHQVLLSVSGPHLQGKGRQRKTPFDCYYSADEDDDDDDDEDDDDDDDIP
uniref:Uncharacterized protein n=1 Tax=Avena sativa TaxID=4498 RepID=A0ACD5TS57_AVESA